MKETINLKPIADIVEISDGYHTFTELYEQSDININAGLSVAWRSKKHADGTVFDGWFIMGLFTEKGSQISYHLPISKWEDYFFARTLDKAPEWDGHTPQDVLKRLEQL